MARKNALVIALGFLGVVAAALAVPFGWQAVGLVVALFALPAILFIGMKYPIVALTLYAALIPFEDAVQIAGLGTLARVAGLLFAACYVLSRSGKISRRTLPLPLWVLAGWSLLSLAWSIHVDLSVMTLWMLIQQLVMAVLVADIAAREEKVVERVLWSYSLACVFTSVLGLTSGWLTDVTRAAAFEGQDQAMFAAALAPGLLFMLWKAMDREFPPLGRIVCLLLLLFPLTAIIASGTRSAWIGVVVGLCALLASQKKSSKFAIVGAVLAGFWLLLLQIPQLAEFAVNRLGTAISSGGAGRVDIWRVGMTIFQENPLFGVGVGGFPAAFTPDAVFRTPGVDPFGSWLYAGRAPHNVFLGVAVETGLVGFLLLGWFLLRTIRVAPKSGIGGVLLSILATYLTQGFFLDLFLRKQFWLIIALILGLAYRALLPSSSPESSMQTVSQPRG